ncbi:MAG TPA: cytochrome b N-terminal domain-containing protein [Dehalococcoidia bacterium]
MGILKGVYRWLDHRLGIWAALRPTLLHPVPRKVNWWYVLGSAALFAFVFQVITGVALAFSYVPSPDAAYDSLVFITDEATLGSVVRGIHYWGASAMVVLVTAHMIHVFLTGSYKYPRELNWLTGVLLLALTLAMAFTGQLLRWNQDAYWGLVVAAQQAGRAPLIGDLLVQLLVAGQTVGGATLTRFYATHVFLLPALMFLLIGTHVYLVLRHGVSEPPVPGEPVDPATYEERYEEILRTDGVPFWPGSAWRDVIFALAVGAVVVAAAVLVGPAELGVRADPTNVDAYPRPDWYFLWYFALLALIPPATETWVILGFPLVVGIVLLALPFLSNKGERSPRRRPWAVGIVGVSGLGVAVLLWAGLRAPWSPVVPPPELPPQVTEGLTGTSRQGAALFQQEACISCHRIAGRGGEYGPDLTHVADRLSREQMTWRILYGGGGMPAYGATLSPAETQALLDFLQTRRGP